MTEDQHILNSAVFTLSSANLLQSFLSLSLLSPVLCPSFLLHPNILCCSLSFYSPCRVLFSVHLPFYIPTFSATLSPKSLVSYQPTLGWCLHVCLPVWGRCVGVSGSCSIVYESLIYQQFSSVHVSSGWQLCTRKRPQAFHPCLSEVSPCCL